MIQSYQHFIRSGDCKYTDSDVVSKVVGEVYKSGDDHECKERIIKSVLARLGGLNLYKSIR